MREREREREREICSTGRLWRVCSWDLEKDWSYQSRTGMCKGSGVLSDLFTDWTSCCSGALDYCPRLVTATGQGLTVSRIWEYPTELKYLIPPSPPPPHYTHTHTHTKYCYLSTSPTLPWYVIF
jgi:hypothetical protein